MGFIVMRATHVRVVCDGCLNESEEICGKRESPAAARALAAKTFAGHGWRHDAALPHGSSADAPGDPFESGRWYGPVCSRKKHLG